MCFNFHIFAKLYLFCSPSSDFSTQPFKQTANENEINYIGLASVLLVTEDGHSPLGLGATI